MYCSLMQRTTPQVKMNAVVAAETEFQALKLTAREMLFSMYNTLLERIPNLATNCINKQCINNFKTHIHDTHITCQFQIH